jgi:hypothetical protein
MDSIISYAKDNFDFITLIVGFIGVMIAVISLLVEVRKKKEQKKND